MRRTGLQALQAPRGNPGCLAAPRGLHNLFLNSIARMALESGRARAAGHSRTGSAPSLLPPRAFGVHSWGCEARGEPEPPRHLCGQALPGTGLLRGCTPPRPAVPAPLRPGSAQFGCRAARSAKRARSSAHPIVGNPSTPPHGGSPARHARHARQARTSAPIFTLRFDTSQQVGEEYEHVTARLPARIGPRRARAPDAPPPFPLKAPA